MKFGRRDLLTIYQAIDLAILMEQTCADANKGHSWSPPDKEMRAEIRKNLRRVKQFEALKKRITAESVAPAEKKGT